MTCCDRKTHSSLTRLQAVPIQRAVALCRIINIHDSFQQSLNGDKVHWLFFVAMRFTGTECEGSFKLLYHNLHLQFDLI